MSTSGRIYGMTRGLIAEDGCDISCDIIFTVSGDPRDAAPVIEIESIGVDDADMRRVVIDRLFEQAAELDAELLAHAAECERDTREDNADDRGHAHRERIAERRMG